MLYLLIPLHLAASIFIISSVLSHFFIHLLFFVSPSCPSSQSSNHIPVSCPAAFNVFVLFLFPTCIYLPNLRGIKIQADYDLIVASTPPYRHDNSNCPLIYLIRQSETKVLVKLCLPLDPLPFPRLLPIGPSYRLQTFGPAIVEAPQGRDQDCRAKAIRRGAK